MKEGSEATPFSRRRLLAAGAAVAAGAARARAADGGAFFALNQVGWQPGWPKVALLVDARPRASVAVLDASSGGPVAEAPTRPPRIDPETGMRVQAVDVSGLERPGRYRLDADGLSSPPFAIDADACRALLRASIASFRLQRCGEAVLDAASGLRHPACHLQDALVDGADGRRIDATGGWHDAGDYGKYAATTAAAAARLLNLEELLPGHVPGFAAEASVGLDWLLKLQRADGAVYRKVSGRAWPGEIMPEADGQPRYAFGISTPETAKAAGAWAIGARVLGPRNPAAARAWLDTALRAWRFLEATPAMRVDRRAGDDGGSGSYLHGALDRDESLTRDDDDRLFAAAELAITTGRSEFARAFEQLAADAPVTLFGWKDVSSLGIVDWLFAGEGAEGRTLRPELADRLVACADAALALAARSPWGRGVAGYAWGSNRAMAEAGIAMLMARRLTRRADLLAGATAQLDWLLGRNPLAQAFVTGFGSRPVRHTHHRMVQASGIEIPGLLVGGPNDASPDDVAPRGRGPFSYADDSRSYATNETAIDYNASFAALVALLGVESGS